MDPRLRAWLITGVSALLAIWLGWQVADGSYGWPALAALIALAAILFRLTGLAADLILLGLLLIGYIVGNRGFAQLMPFPRLPLLPAEIGLALGGGWLLVESALQRRPPFRRDLLNLLIMLWLVVGTARVAFDVPRHGFLAVRDYAMIYYAGFFFLAQRFGTDPRARTYLTGCLTLATVLLVPVFFLFTAYPRFFLGILTWQGVPLIYLKGDLAATVLAAGSVLVFHAGRGVHRYWGWPLAVAAALVAVFSDCRAALFGLALAVLGLVAARRWTYPAVQTAAGLIGVVVLAGLAFIGNLQPAEARLHRMYDKVVSMVDITGSRVYESDLAYKGDNNRFRLVWWHTVVQETWDGGRVFGLGFGHDLARSFVQQYNPEMGEEFAARSPHNIAVTTFGRMGAVGVAVLLGLIGAMAARTWHTLKDVRADPAQVGLWCAAWVILGSALFGVVLEGPMGAVVFWTLLGLASGGDGGEPDPATMPPEDGAPRAAGATPSDAT